MKLTLRQLRRLIREFGLDADMRNMAGSVMDLAGNDRESSVNLPPPGLGGTTQEEEDESNGQEKSQPGARAADRLAR